jgi:hypothetical protein
MADAVLDGVVFIFSAKRGFAGQGRFWWSREGKLIALVSDDGFEEEMSGFACWPGMVKKKLC